MKSVIKFEAEDAKKARSLVLATIPDNVNTPKYLRVKSLVRGRLVKFSIETPRLDTLVATIDDLLSCIQATEKSMVVVRK